MAQCVQESGLQIPAIETEDCLCQIGRNMLSTDPLMRVSNAVEFQRRNRTFSRIPLVTIARKPYILIAIIDTLMLPIGDRDGLAHHPKTRQGFLRIEGRNLKMDPEQDVRSHVLYYTDGNIVQQPTVSINM